MAARDRTATRWLLAVTLQVPALLTLQSCKNDQVEMGKGAAQHPGERAVFGSAPNPNPSEARPRTTKTTKIAPQVSQPARAQERARASDPIGPKSRVTPPAVSQGSPITDPGERRVGDGGVQVASNLAPRQPAAERFLHYEPPGTSVGDTGELTRRTTEPQISTSTKPIRELIRRWADTLLTGDVAGHISLYAGTLDRFNGSPNVGRETVKRSKQRVVAGFAGVRRFEIYDVRLVPSRNGSMIAEFRIESDDGAGGVDGWYRLQMRQVDAQWKIYGEERVKPVSGRRGY